MITDYKNGEDTLADFNDDASQSSSSSSPTVSSSSSSNSSSSDDDNDDDSSSSSSNSNLSDDDQNTSSPSNLDSNIGLGPEIGGKNFSMMMARSVNFNNDETSQSDAAVATNISDVKVIAKDSSMDRNDHSLENHAQEEEVVAQVLPNDSDDSDDEDEDLDSPPKKKTMRIKLSLSKTTSKQVEVHDNKDENGSADKKRKLDSIPAVEATVISSVATPSRASTKPKPKSKSSSSFNSNQQQNNFSCLRPIKMPPIASPGLLMTNSNSNNHSNTNNSSSTNTSSKGNNGNTVNTNPLNSNSNTTSSTNGNSNNSNNNNTSTPSHLFDSIMEAAGYTMEQRTLKPHRGSSVTREVGDMFDRDVMLTLNFPPLVPSWMLSEQNKKQNSEKAQESEVETNANQDNLDSQPSPLDKKLPSIFMESISEFFNLDPNDVKLSNGNKYPSKDKTLQFIDMIPTSLTTTFPESYILKRIQYEEAVVERERIITESQKVTAKAEDEMMAYEEAKDKWDNKSDQTDSASNMAPQPPPTFAPIEVPPIPRPPTPPTVIVSCPSSPSDIAVTTIMHKNDDNNKTYEKDDHPIPPEKHHLVAHLDPTFFKPTKRYYGLLSNSIADPQFVGPNAPGLTGGGSSGSSNHALSGNTGLATAQSSSSSGGGGGGGGNNSNSGHANTGGGSGPSQHPNPGGSASSSTGESSKKDQKSNTSSSDVNAKNDDKSGGGSKSGTFKSNKKSSSSSGIVTVTDKKKQNSGSGKWNQGACGKNSGIAATATNAQLKKALEVGGEFANDMRISLIKAAIYACENGTEGPWVAYNGETYPDISKAFAMHGGLRPCARCKSNKQGAYHCRLRRKHKELDYDGRNSCAILETIKGKIEKNSETNS